MSNTKALDFIRDCRTS